MRLFETMRKINEFFDKIEENRPTMASWIPKSWKQLVYLKADFANMVNAKPSAGIAESILVNRKARVNCLWFF